DAECFQGIGISPLATTWRSRALPQPASCSENFVIPPDVFGQTLRHRTVRLPETAQGSARAVTDRFAPKRCATRQGARQRPLPDAENFGGGVSWGFLAGRGATYSLLMIIGSIQAHAAYLDGAGPFLDFTCDEFLQIFP